MWMSSREQCENLGSCVEGEYEGHRESAGMQTQPSLPPPTMSLLMKPQPTPSPIKMKYFVFHSSQDSPKDTGERRYPAMIAPYRLEKFQAAQSRASFVLFHGCFPQHDPRSQMPAPSMNDFNRAMKVMDAVLRSQQGHRRPSPSRVYPDSGKPSPGRHRPPRPVPAVPTIARSRA